MRFSFIIPAYNAAGTLASALDSLVRQTNPDWEAIVVDDGSTDATPAVVAGYARRDSRIRVIRQSNAGMGAARNAGLREARGEWVIFLDADDWMDPQALIRFSRAASEDPQAQAIYGHFVRVTPSGDVVEEMFWPSPEGLFPVVARFCPFAIHSCAVRRPLIDLLHGFDPEFRYCADWDLWQRLARGGTRIAVTDSTVAFYRMSTGSSIANVEGIAAEGMEIIARGHRRDPRVREPDPRYADGAAGSGLASALLGFLCWQAGIVLGLGRDARPLLRLLGPDIHDPELKPAAVAHALYGAAPLSRGVTPRAWAGLWDEVAPELTAFLAALEAKARAPGLARRTQNVLEQLVREAALQRPLTVGRCHAIRLEVTEPLADLDLPAGVERLHCALTIEGKTLGELELPVVGARITAALLADAIVAEQAWAILNRFFSHAIYPALERERGDGGITVRRGGTLLSEGLPDTDPGSVALHQAVGWTVFLQELYGLPDWSLDRFNADTHETEAHVIPVGGADAQSIELCDRLPQLATAVPLDVEWTLAGVPVCFARVEPVDGTIGSQRLRSIVIKSVGYELARVAVREGLLGGSLATPASLRERLMDVATRNRLEPAPHSGPGQPSAAPGTRLAPSWQAAVTHGRERSAIALFRRAHGVSGTSASRRALLPSASAAELIELSRQEGEPFLATTGERDIVPLSYMPEALWMAPAVNAGGEARQKQPTPAPTTLPGSLRSSSRLPILLYHRVAEGEPGPLDRYRVSPEQFEAQIRYLRNEGFHSVTLEEWAAAMRRWTPVEGRPVLITFDDGYRDFAEGAWPVLQRYGFGALVFLVSERVGGSTEWTSSYGETAPLLDWSEIRRLRDEGVQFGSHSATHPHFEALSPADVVREAVRSRIVLQRELGAPVTSLAYPNGSEDRAIHHLVGACGYLYGLSCRVGLSGFNDPLLALPRVEIMGEDTLPDFIRKLEPDSFTSAGS